jgi:hypothetical protein
VNEVLAVKLPVLCEPETAVVPDQPPDAVHEVALVELHVRVDEPPDVTLFGLADIKTVGAAAGGGEEVEPLRASVP